MFEITVDFHDSTSPRTRTFANHVEAALYLERLPSCLGYLANQRVTVELCTVSDNAKSATLFDISERYIA